METQVCRSDITIIGAGPAGSVLAILMARAGWSVALVDKSDFKATRIGEHLSPKGHAVIHSLGLGQILNHQKHLKSDRVCSYWGADEPYFQDYFMSPYGSGWNLDRLQFDKDLCKEAHKVGCQLFTQTLVTDIHFCQSRNQWQTDASNSHGERLRLVSGFLVDATGRKAFVARHLGIKRNRIDKLVGILAHLTCPQLWQSMSNHLYLGSAENGWFYSLKLTNQKTAVVFMTDSDITGDLLKSNKKQHWLQSLINSRLGSSITANAPSDETQISLTAFPADSGHLESFSGTQWMAVGDAALSFDPLASRGVGFALETAQKAAEALCSRAHQATAFAQYNAFLDNAWQTYLEQRPDVFRAEQRWTGAPFWKRRIMSQ